MDHAAAPATERPARPVLITGVGVVVVGTGFSPDAFQDLLVRRSSGTARGLRRRFAAHGLTPPWKPAYCRPAATDREPSVDQAARLVDRPRQVGAAATGPTMPSFLARSFLDPVTALRALLRRLLDLWWRVDPQWRRRVWLHLLVRRRRRSSSDGPQELLLASGHGPRGPTPTRMTPTLAIRGGPLASL